MKRKSTETLAYTVNKFSQIVSFDRQAIASRLAELRAVPVAESPQGAGLYHLRDLVRALLGGNIELERLRLIRAQADKLESQLAERNRQLVPVAESVETVIACAYDIRNAILALPIPHADQDKLLLEMQKLATVWQAKADALKTAGESVTAHSHNEIRNYTPVATRRRVNHSQADCLEGNRRRRPSMCKNQSSGFGFGRAMPPSGFRH